MEILNSGPSFILASARRPTGARSISGAPSRRERGQARLSRMSFRRERIKNIKLAYCLNSQRMLYKWRVFHMSAIGRREPRLLFSSASIFMGADHHGFLMVGNE